MKLCARSNPYCTGFAEGSPRIIAGGEHPYDDAVVNQQGKAKTMCERAEQCACLNSHAKRSGKLRQEAEEKWNTVKQDIAHEQAESGSMLTAQLPDTEMQKALARRAAAKENAEQNGVEEHFCHKCCRREAETEKRIDARHFEKSIEAKDDIGVNKQRGSAPDD